MAETGFELGTSTCIFCEMRANSCISIPAHFLSINGTAEEVVSLMFIPVLALAPLRRGETLPPSSVGSCGPGCCPFVPSTSSWRSLDPPALLTQGCMFLFSTPLSSARSRAPLVLFQDPFLGVLRQALWGNLFTTRHGDRLGLSPSEW